MSLGARHGPGHSCCQGDGARGTLPPASGIDSRTEGGGAGDSCAHSRLLAPELPVSPHSAGAGILIGDKRGGHRFSVSAGRFRLCARRRDGRWR
eukprot:1616537-Pleurochrysis_carterae.AAC.1